MKLTENFSLNEFFVEKEPEQEVGDDIKYSLFLVAHFLLQPVRDQFYVPIKITSGYRDERLNTSVGGSKYSRHMLGIAGDFTTPSDPELLQYIFLWIQDNLKGLFGELIYYKKRNFIHISLPKQGVKVKIQTR